MANANPSSALESNRGDHEHMDVSVIFARHFSRLVQLILRKPGEIDEAELRALVTVSRLGGVTLAVRESTLCANDFPVPVALPGVGDLLAQLIAHGLGAIFVDADALPADLLGAARILAGMPVLDDGGAAAEARRLALSASSVRFAARPREQQYHAPPAPARASEALAEFDFLEVFDDPKGKANAVADILFRVCRREAQLAGSDSRRVVGAMNS